MKKFILLLFISLLILLTTGCSINKTSDLEPTKVTSEELLGFKIEKIVLSKGYQTLEPKIESLTEDNKTKLSISFGLVECSGVTIDKITKKGNEINIYTNRLLEDDKTQLVIPQAIVSLEEALDVKKDEIKFNIVNQNYTPIELKFGKSQILNTIYSKFKIEPNSIPNVNLVRHKDGFIWDVVFNGIYDKGNLKTPLINLNVKADALTGEIIHSDKNIVSDYIDDGVILDYISKKYLLYKQENTINGEDVNYLWLYDLAAKEKEKIYETNDNIYLARFSPNHKSISLIENDEGVSDIYLIDIEKKITNKITPVGYSHTWKMKWKDLDNIYFLNNDTKDRSTLLSYNISNNSVEEVFKISKNISNFDIVENMFLLEEYDEKNINKNIFITKNGLTLEKIDEGHNVSFLDSDSIIYLKNIPEKNEDKLNLYNLNDKSIKLPTGIDVKNYLKLNSEVLLIIGKGVCENSYTLSSLNIVSGAVTEIGSINNEHICYDEELNKGYISLTPPLENNNRNIIYSIDFQKLKIGCDK